MTAFPSKSAPGDLMRIDIDLSTPSATARLAAALARRARPKDVIALQGDLGAGKTHFARSFIRTLAPDAGDVPSPTFTLVQSYAANIAGAPVEIWHFDLYRLKAAEEAYDLAIEEAFAEGISLIEWPGKLGSLLPQHRLQIDLEILPDGVVRRAVITGDATWRDRLATLLQELSA
jgi:tRNA threonylcarbamoyladenosine biosynthesis protein TsaE